MLRLTATLRVSHQFRQFCDRRSPRYREDGPADAIRDIYRALDDSLGRLLNAVGDDPDDLAIVLHEYGYRGHVPDVESVIGAPVVDGMVSGFKLAEMMGDLHGLGIPTVSRRGWFEKPPVDDMTTLRRFLGRPLYGS